MDLDKRNLDGIIENAISSCNSEDLVKFLTSKEISANEVDYFITKIGEYLDIFLCDTIETFQLVGNILHLFSELAEVVQFDVQQKTNIARILLIVSSEEYSPITNIKKAVNTLNTFLSESCVAVSLMEDETLEGTIQIFGRRIPFTGDFECQALLFEALCRLACTNNLKNHWSSIWFTSDKLKSMFLKLNPQQFELEIRKFLNYLNRIELVQRVFSFVATSISFGDFQLQKPHGSDFWIDINYGSESIAFFCSDSFNEDQESYAWETIVIPINIIRNYIIVDQPGNKLQSLTLHLNCSCSELITSVSTPLEFESNEIRITFWTFLNITENLSKLFGDNKTKTSENSQRKVSQVEDMVQVEEDDTSRIPSELDHMTKIQKAAISKESTRKMSQIDDIIQVEGSVTSDILPEFNDVIVPKEKDDKNSEIFVRKASKLNEMVKINDQEKNEVPTWREQMKDSQKLARKASDLDEMIKIAEKERNEGKQIKESKKFLRKASNLDEKMGFTEQERNEVFEIPSKKLKSSEVEEIINSEDNKLPNSQSSFSKVKGITKPKEVINMDTSKQKEKITEEIAPVSLVEDESLYFISPTPAVTINIKDSKKSMSAINPKVITKTKFNTCKSNSIIDSQSNLIDSKISESQPTDNSQILAPKTKMKKMKLYNLDCAPLYDLPPTRKSKSDPINMKLPLRKQELKKDESLKSNSSEESKQLFQDCNEEFNSHDCVMLESESIKQHDIDEVEESVTTIYPKKSRKSIQEFDEGNEVDDHKSFESKSIKNAQVEETVSKNKIKKTTQDLSNSVSVFFYG